MKKDLLSNIPNYKVIALGTVTNKDNWRGLIVRLLTILIILFLVVFLVEKIIDKFFGLKRKKISETPGKSIDRWGRTIILFIFLLSNSFGFTKEPDAIPKWSWVPFLTALMGFQAILEWKYLKESKQYISTFISSTIIITIFLFGVYFYS